MKMTKHFDSKEFDCKDGTPYPKDWRADRLKPLCKALEKIRAAHMKPLIISSGYRTLAYNRKIGGARKSQHMAGRAADIHVPGVAVHHLYAAMLDLIRQGDIPNGGLGLYPTFVHYDQRESPARWTGSRMQN